MSILRDVSFSTTEMEKGLHQAVALVALTLLITAHRAIMNSGFVLRRTGLSTDTVAVLIIGLVTCFWTSMVLVSALQLEDKPCRIGFEQCAARMAYAPWMMLILFFFWIIAYIDEVRELHIKEYFSNKATPDTRLLPSGTIDPESKKMAKPAYSWAHPKLHWPTIGTLHIWKMECSQGPLNWKGSIRLPYRLGLYSIMLSVVAIVAYGALRQRLYTIGLLNIVGVVLFIADAAGSNNYTAAPHMYTRDTLRIMLHTRHREGTCYILPEKHRGFDAVWGPRIEYENRALDAAVQKWRDDGGYTSGKIQNLDSVMASFNASTRLSHDDVNDIAGWLYQPSFHPKMQNISCRRKKGVHLIASSIMLSLWQAEYIVMMRHLHINEAYQKMMGKLRSPRGAGLNLAPTHQIGAGPDEKAGLEGYRKAVEYIYLLFGEQVDTEAKTPTSPSPKTSVILAPDSWTTIETYTAQLWTYCFEHFESTFSAFYAFTIYWQADIGMDQSKGRHGFPFEARDYDGDLVGWHVIWRQAWYQVVIAQLTTMSPIIFGAFIGGILS